MSEENAENAENATTETPAHEAAPAEEGSLEKAKRAFFQFKAQRVVALIRQWQADLGFTKSTHKEVKAIWRVLAQLCVDSEIHDGMIKELHGRIAALSDGNQGNREKSENRIITPG